MKKNKLKIVSILSILILALTLLLSSAFTTPQEDIIGSWVSNGDELWKITFTQSGERKDYYEGVLTDTYSYSLTNSCGTYLRENNEYFLKTADNQNSITCDLLNGFHEDENGIITLSITSENGKLLLFTKEN